MIEDKLIKGAKILKKWIGKSDNQELKDLVDCFQSAIFAINKRDLRIEHLEMQVKSLTKQLIDEQVKSIVNESKG